MVLYYVSRNLFISSLGNFNLWWLILLTFTHCSFSSTLWCYMIVRSLFDTNM